VAGASQRRVGPRTDLLGDGLTALCGGALALTLLGVLGMLGVLAANGAGYFWQKRLVLVELDDGSRLLGEIHGREPIPEATTAGAGATRMRIKVANRDLFGADFVWVDERRVVTRSRPRDAVLLERQEWGNLHGTLEQLRRGEVALARGPDEVRRALGPLLEHKRRQRVQVQRLAQREIGDVSARLERLRLARRALELEAPPEAERARRARRIEAEAARLTTEYEALSRRLFAAREQLLAESVSVAAADGRRVEVAVGEIVRLIYPNAIGRGERLALYLHRLWEFVSSDPRESNTEGGIFPAIFGTVMMVFVMSFVVAPFGVLAALYLREYAKQGPLVRLVRIAVNNLAGVPSIVFGVFGLGFFVYLVGGTIDRLFFPAALPAPTFGTGGILWASLTLALLTVPVVIVATEEGLAAVPRVVREGSLALGATRFETTWRVVVPAAAPGILTGLILAMARAAGEVAPLMIVGMVKLAPALPIGRDFPYLHLEGKFMHMGFHIYDVGFQSPNVEATKPLVFATALLLILVVTAMNLLAIALRNHLRARYPSSAV